MAHLRGSDRGQLMLVGALALAVLFVSFAFLLNTAIYTETVASRGTGVEAVDVVGYGNAATEATAGTIDRVSVGGNDSYDSIHRNVTAAIGDWDDGTARQYASEGDAPSTEVASVTNGTRIVQNETRNFTDASASEDWTLATDVRTRNYTMAVEDGGLAGDATNAFNVTFDNGSATYSVRMYDPGSGVEIRTTDGDGSVVGTCDRPGPSVRIDFAAGTANGSSCDALDFYRTLEGDYEVRYANADNVSGTYSLTASVRHDDLAGSNFVAYGGDGPFRSTAIYSADIEVVYRSPTVYYRSEVTVAPNAAEVAA
ncbi:hypothetical protein [Halorarum salinum]|uniref:Uncharacterized protein n=1 Tax=Halorarum salinum TaxID=2743089 RepID=A0A7D5QCT1_9EURY|nr:hypothetical protein [Halobaculum salinum]QLG62800.1 hypothetical protein HUG12_14120 [Halobaculum salinum]